MFEEQVSRLHVVHMHTLRCTCVQRSRADRFVCTTLVKVNPQSLKAKGSDRVGVASSSSVPAALRSMCSEVHGVSGALSHVSGIPDLLSAPYKEPKVLADEGLFPNANHCGIISVTPRCSAEISPVWLTQPLPSTPLAGWAWGRSLAGPALSGSFRGGH